MMSICKDVCAFCLLFNKTKNSAWYGVGVEGGCNFYSMNFVHIYKGLLFKTKTGFMNKEEGGNENGDGDCGSGLQG